MYGLKVYNGISLINVLKAEMDIFFCSWHPWLAIVRLYFIKVDQFIHLVSRMVNKPAFINLFELSNWCSGSVNRLNYLIIQKIGERQVTLTIFANQNSRARHFDRLCVIFAKGTEKMCQIESYMPQSVGERKWCVTNEIVSLKKVFIQKWGCFQIT